MVGTVTRLWDGRPRNHSSIPGNGNIFTLSPEGLNPLRRLTHPLLKGSGAYYLEIKGPGNNSPPSRQDWRMSEAKSSLPHVP